MYSEEQTDLVLSLGESDGWKLPSTLTEWHLSFDLVMNQLRVSHISTASTLPQHTRTEQSYTEFW